MGIYRLVMSCILAVSWGSSAAATIWNVSSISQFRSAMAAVSPGDEIRVAYGTYMVSNADDPKHWFQRAGTTAAPIRIIGQSGPNGERPVFNAGSATYIDRGIFYIWSSYPNYVIENLEFCNARGNNIYSNNAAAAYILADNITFRNCYSHHNDNGWFSTDTADNTLIEYCETAYNGYGDGYSHNYYVNSGSITIRGNYIHDSCLGQNFKTRARHLVFDNNFMERPGNYSWEIASGNQNNALMRGNVIIAEIGRAHV